MTARTRHVSVRPAHVPTEMPGLVLEWRRTPDWEAQVIYVEPVGNVVLEWVPAERLGLVQLAVRLWTETEGNPPSPGGRLGLRVRACGEEQEA